MTSEKRWIFFFLQKNSQTIEEYLAERKASCKGVSWGYDILVIVFSVCVEWFENLLLQFQFDNVVFKAPVFKMVKLMLWDSQLIRYWHFQMVADPTYNPKASCPANTVGQMDCSKGTDAASVPESDSFQSAEKNCIYEPHLTDVPAAIFKTCVIGYHSWPGGPYFSSIAKPTAHLNRPLQVKCIHLWLAQMTVPECNLWVCITSHLTPPGKRLL